SPQHVTVASRVRAQAKPSLTEIAFLENAGGAALAAGALAGGALAAGVLAVGVVAGRSTLVAEPVRRGAASGALDEHATKTTSMERIAATITRGLCALFSDAAKLPQSDASSGRGAERVGRHSRGRSAGLLGETLRHSQRR